jgi:hypothetical protein
MSINTADGWNRFVDKSHNRLLRDRGIEPTPEALAAFQAEVDQMVAELRRKYPPVPIPVIYRRKKKAGSGGNR